MSVRLKAYVFLALLVVLGAAGFLIQGQYSKNEIVRASSGGTAEEQQAVPVELVEATGGPISAYLTSTCNLRALRDVEVAAHAEGVVRQVLVEEGDAIESGQLLCLLDDRELQIKLNLTKQKLAQVKLQLEKAKIQNEKAEVQIKNTQAELKRNEKAFAEGLVSEKEVDDLRYKLAELEHDQRVAASQERENTHHVEELEAESAQVELEISRKRVTAPFSGRITERKVQLGQTVRNLDPLFQLAAFSPLHADVHLSERDARHVQPGQQARITLGTDGDESAVGRVVRVSPVVDDGTGTVKVTLELSPSEKAFKPGAFVRVSIQTDSRENATLIPKRALIEEDGQMFVFVTENDVARRRKVTLGYEAEREVEVQSGVDVGEKVVVAGQGNLKEGDKVREVES